MANLSALNSEGLDDEVIDMRLAVFFPPSLVDTVLGLDALSAIQGSTGSGGGDSTVGYPT